MAKSKLSELLVDAIKENGPARVAADIGISISSLEKYKAGEIPQQFRTRNAIKSYFSIQGPFDALL